LIFRTPYFLCCGSVIAVMESAEPRARHNSATGGACRDRPPERSVLVQSKVRSIFVVIADVLGQEAFQMALVERDHVIKQITATASNPTFCNAVLLRTSEGSSRGHAAHSFYCLQHLESKLFISVKDEVFVRKLERKSLTQLPHNPIAGRMRRYIEMQDAPNRWAIIQKSLSNRSNRGLGCRRFITASCCRSARFSNTSFPRLWKRRTTAPNQSKNRLCMNQGYSRPRRETRLYVIGSPARKHFGERQLFQSVRLF